MAASRSEERVLIIAPIGRDAELMAATLEAQRIATKICSSPSDCCRDLAEGAGGLLLTEEALERPGVADLFVALKAQPAWSELPVIILTQGGEWRSGKLLDLTTTAAGSVTLLERPLSPATLLCSVEVALRFRRRQYQVRDLLQALEQAQQELRQYSTDLERAVAERTVELHATHEQLETFVYSVAHDLRAPLRSMTGYSQLLLDDYAAGLEQSAQSYLRRIQAASEFMERMLLDLLAYGRAARIEIELGPVEIRKCWETALFQCATQIEQTEARVETVEPLPTVIAHEATLAQCLANLLSNALKFVAEGAKPEVRFWAEERADEVRLFVQDNGIGISADQHERVFRVFERSHGTRYPGTGIGLSIVRKGVERMGGQVGLESHPGQGSRFWIQLPKAH